MQDFTFTELGVSDIRWGQALLSVVHDVYQLPGYLELEAERMLGRPAAALVTWAKGWLLVPYVVRDVGIEPGAEDLSSPYGYAGYLVSEGSSGSQLRGAFTVLVGNLARLGYCSLFLRLHPYLNSELVGFPIGVVHRTGETVNVDLAQPLDTLLGEVNNAKRRRAAHLASDGYEASFVPYREGLEDFHQTYLDTMRRVDATSEYFSFTLAYFQRLAGVLGDRLIVGVVRRDGVVISTLLVAASCGIAHTLFSGTYSVAMSHHPSVLLTIEAIKWCKQRGYKVLHLGGGLGGHHDSLFQFKSEFSKGRLPFRTIRLVLDSARYERLAYKRARELGLDEPGRLDPSFFPTYRSPDPDVDVVG